MNFADQYYVRLYTYDTPGWLMMKWQAKATLPLLMRKVDRAGVLDLAEYAGEEMPAVVSRLIDLPIDVVEVGLADLIKRKTIVLRGQFLVLPNFIEGQESIQTDRLRKAEQRARYRDRTMAIERGLVPQRDNVSPATQAPADPTNVAGADTSRDNSSRADTPSRDPSSQNGTECHATPDHGHSSSAVSSSTSKAKLCSDSLATDGHIFHELKSHDSLTPIANIETASMLARRFATIELQRGAKLAWAIEAIREAAADSAGLGLKPEALLKKLRSYVDNARGPKAPKDNGAGASRYSHSDAVIVSKELTPEEQEAMRQRAAARAASLGKGAKK